MGKTAEERISAFETHHNVSWSKLAREEIAAGKRWTLLEAAGFLACGDEAIVAQVREWCPPGNALPDPRAAMAASIHLTRELERRRNHDMASLPFEDAVRLLLDHLKEGSITAYVDCKAALLTGHEFREFVYIQDVVQHYTGPRDRPYSGEQAYQRVMSLAGERGDRERLAGVMRGLSPDERADVASTVAASLGRRTVDDDFSPARFVTQAQKMPAAAREAVFGREGAEAINDLIHIATAKRDTANSLNRSRSGQVANYDRFLTGAFGVLGAGGGYAAGGVGGAAAGTVAAAGVKFAGLNLTARLLTNPRFVEWLGRAPNQTTPAQITAHVRRLGNIAARNPTIRGELSQIQQLLVADVGRARAEEGNDGRQEP